MRYSKEESKMIWDQNAEFWDYTMGDESNDFHRNVVRPKVTELLNPNSSDYILDIACGNGNYSAYLAEKGISVVGFDYGEKMIELAKKRRKHNTDRIEFYVADATNEISMKTLKRNRMFTKAVSNMAVMDITDIKPLFTAVYNLIEDEVDKQLLFLALKNLNEREKEIVKLRFGLDGYREKTQKEVADMLGISQSYISRLEKKIINRLKKEINKMI